MLARENYRESGRAVLINAGLRELPWADLMEATGLEKGGIYRHFPSKEAVAAEAFDYAWEAAFQERVRDLGSIPESVDRLKHLISNFCRAPFDCPRRMSSPQYCRWNNFQKVRGS